MLNKVKISVGGTDYTIATDETEAYVCELAAQIDQNMQQLVDGSGHLSMLMAAVLTALNKADEAHKAAEDADNLRAQMKGYLEDNTRMRQESDALRRECDKLRRELHELRAGRNPAAPIK